MEQQHSLSDLRSVFVASRVRIIRAKRLHFVIQNQTRSLHVSQHESENVPTEIGLPNCDNEICSYKLHHVLICFL